MKELTLTAVQVQPSPERAANFPDAIHWAITLTAPNGRAMQTEYSEGIGHFIRLPYGQRRTLDVDNIIKTISGQKSNVVAYGDVQGLSQYFTARVKRNGVQLKVIPPQTLDVLQSLAMDATALDEKFEDWAANYGYEVDSRKAFATWQKCCDIARDLKALGFTEEELQALREEA
jgi:hypothetical protein